MKADHKKMLIYQVLPRLFGNDNLRNKPNGTLEENGCGKLIHFSKEILNEICSMGFTHIWYTGIIEHATQTDYTAYGIRKDHKSVVKGKAGSPYAIKDYYDVDPDLAVKVENRMLEWEELVTRTHQAGLKVIIDFVPNHVARTYHSDIQPLDVSDFGEKDNTHVFFDPQNNFYYLPGQSFSPEFGLEDEGVTYTETPCKATGNNCFHAHPRSFDWYETIKLNYGVDYLDGQRCHFDPIPDTWYKMLDILFYWAGKQIDCFRCDMAEMVPVEFWSWVIPQVKATFPQVEFIAEIYNPNQYHNYIWNGQFDYLYDKVGMYDTLRSIVRGELSAKAITSCWQSVEGIQQHMLYFLENHDEQRIASPFFADDPWKAIPALVVAATLSTNPLLIYFGQEIGEQGMEAEGFSGLDGRTTLFDYWSLKTISYWINQGKLDGKLLTESQRHLRAFYVHLLRLCNREKAIREGVFFDLMYANYDNPRFNTDKLYAYVRRFENELLLIVVNFGPSDVETAVYIPEHLFEYFQLKGVRILPDIDLLTGEKVSLSLQSNAFFELQLKVHSSKIIKFLLKSNEIDLT